MKSYNIAVLPGDGIGPEVMDAALRVLGLVGQEFNIKFDYQEELFGGCSIDKYGIPLTKETIKNCKKADSVLLGAVVGPKWEDQPHSNKPEQGLLKLRKS